MICIASVVELNYISDYQLQIPKSKSAETILPIYHNLHDTPISRLGLICNSKKQTKIPPIPEERAELQKYTKQR